MNGVPTLEYSSLRYVDISVAVPTVERRFSPMRFWSIWMTGDRFRIASTSGLGIFGINLRENALNVSMSCRCASA